MRVPAAEERPLDALLPRFADIEIRNMPRLTAWANERMRSRSRATCAKR